MNNRGLEALSQAIKDNQFLQYINAMGNSFSDRGLNSLTKILEGNKNSKLMILKIGDLWVTGDNMTEFLNKGFLSSSSLRYL